MATPQSTVYVGKVPWSPDYSHVRYYSNTTEQYEDIIQLCTYAIPTTNYTYIRKDSVIKVNGIAELLQYCNYVMYKNANFPSLWVYAFITDCRYINDNTAELAIETDIWQTFSFGMKFTNPVYMERSHRSFDVKGDNIKPEPVLMDCDYWYGTRYADENGSKRSLDLKPDTVIIETTADVDYTDPFGDPDTVPQSRVDIYGDVYGGQPHGTALYAFPLENVTQDEYGAFRFVWDLNKVGAGDAIVNMFAFPSALMYDHEIDARDGRGYFRQYEGNKTGYWGKHRLSPSLYRPIVTIETTWPSFYESTEQSTVPRNKKLLTYPYCFCRVIAPDGNFIDLKYEKWGSTASGGTPYTLAVYSQLTPDANAIAMPFNYSGMGANIGEALTFPVAFRIPWVNSAYLNWSAQHHIGNMINAAANIAMMGVPTPQAFGAGVVAKVFGTGVKSVAQYAKNYGTKNLAHNIAAITKNTGSWAKAYGTGIHMTEGMSPVMGVMGLANMHENIAYNMMQPNSSRGSLTNLSMYNGNAWSASLNVVPMFLRSQMLKCYDMFFDVFGYEQDELLYVNFTSRPRWIYYKGNNTAFTANLNMYHSQTGNFIIGAPPYAVDHINSMFDNGVTVWKTTDHFGDYDPTANILT